MTKDKFKAAYIEAAGSLIAFVNNNGSEGGFHSFHDVPPLNIYDGCLTNKGEYLFSTPAAKTKKDRQVFDNFARMAAPQIFEGIMLWSFALQDHADPEFYADQMKEMFGDDPDFAAQKKERTPEEQAEYERCDKVFSRHDQETKAGGQAFYEDISEMLRDMTQRVHNNPGHFAPFADVYMAYHDWMQRYLNEKIAGKDDAAILPLPLNVDFDDLQRRAKPAPSPGPKP